MNRQRIRKIRRAARRSQEHEEAAPNLALALTRVQNNVSTPQDMMRLQGTLGNQAVNSLMRKPIQREGQQGRIEDPSNKAFRDFDSKQYRVSGKEPNRKVEEVKRTELPNGHVVYYAMGVVIGFKDAKPIVEYYSQPINLGDWFPRVTHVNGMNVEPEDGINDAISLQNHLSNQLEEHGEDLALGQDAVDVLYTYSTTLGFGWDVLDCIKGKLGIDDDVVEVQKQTMIDAVEREEIIHICAHSRGTIKTDNAVREAFAALAEMYIPEVWDNISRTIPLTAQNRARYDSVVRDLAKTRAKEQMDCYIHLIYAGDAVQFPSSVLPIDFIVSYGDAVSLLFGTYSRIGAENMPYSHDRSTMTTAGSGHSFSNYAPTAAAIIGKAILKER